MKKRNDKKGNNKGNNKGFSLVELIVVILIMAVIAVVLVPQVMKWVGKSQDSTDESNIAAYKSAISVAVADAQAEGWVLKPITVAVKLDKVAVNAAETDAGADYKIFYKSLKEVLAEDYSLSSKNAFFEFTISDKGEVKVVSTTVTPTPTTTP